MDNKQATAEWIAQQRQISEIVNMTYEDAPGSVVPLLKQLEKSQTAALDALEASMQRETEKDAEIERLATESPIDLESIAEAVHNAWWKEKIKQGGADGHPDAKPYTELSESVKEYDRVTAREVLNAIRPTMARLTDERDAAVQTAVQKCWMVRKAGELGYTEPPIINGRCFGYGGGDSDEPPCEECSTCGLCAENALEGAESEGAE